MVWEWKEAFSGGQGHTWPRPTDFWHQSLCKGHFMQDTGSFAHVSKRGRSPSHPQGRAAAGTGMVSDPTAGRVRGAQDGSDLWAVWRGELGWLSSWQTPQELTEASRGCCSQTQTKPQLCELLPNWPVWKSMTYLQHHGTETHLPTWFISKNHVLLLFSLFSFFFPVWCYLVWRPVWGEPSLQPHSPPDQLISISNTK